MRLKKYSPVPKRYKFLQIVNEAEATSLARQNRPRFKVKDNLFSSGDGGVRGYSPIGSRIEAIYRYIVVIGFLTQPALLSLWTR
ncbi:hypothetical protein HpHNI57_00110 [Helicobacter pylori]